MNKEKTRGLKLRCAIVTTCAVMLIMPAACAPASRASDFCALYRPVYLHEGDTEETKIQIDGNNAVWVEICEGL